ncbi:MAG: MBL fold metallo-hydrolase [Methyloligellaceae bacterium]
MTTTQIFRIPIMPMGMVNAFLIKSPAGAILVDTGLPGTEKEIKKAMNRASVSIEDIKLIIITHAHIDHAGNVSLLKRMSGAPVLGHKADLPYFRQEQKMTFCPTGWFGRLFLKTGLIQKSYKAFTPDILLNNGDEMNLQEFGYSGTIRHTPGHTEGSISVELSDGNALVGDLISSGILLGGTIRTGRAKRPPFEDDPHAVSHELQKMVKAGIHKFHMGHGGPLGSAEVTRHANYLKTLQAIPCCG